MGSKEKVTNKGLPRFYFFLDQVEQLLAKSAKQKNPALWLYNNNVRTPLFMLEGLSKLYAELHNTKQFIKLKEQFKLLEDNLGAIDFYDSFAKEFNKNKKIPAAITNYLQAQTREKIQSLNELLSEKEWLNADNSRISKIRKKLKEVEWKKEETEIKNIRLFYENTIAEINDFSRKMGAHFDNVEADIHELRRKIRWLSIYPQALRGSIQLSKTKSIPKQLSKYLVKDITSSAFNKMPEAATNRHFLLLDQHYYYALSWMIAELGKLKDNGLRIIAIKEALQQTADINEKDAYKKAYQLAGKQQLQISQILNKATAICKTYFKEKNLDQLIIGTGNIT